VTQAPGLGDIQARPVRLLVLLTLSYIMAQAATQVMGLLVVPVQASLHASDTQMGFLQGFAFILIFSLAGIPIARLTDRGDRVRIIAWCILFFSLATIVSGLAGSFTILALLRAGTAVAEAGLPPAAFSMFSESRSVRGTARATATFMLSPFIGAGVALGGGGIVTRLLPHWQLAAALGFDQPWRIVLLLIGLPGILLAALLVTLTRDSGRGRERVQRPSSALPLRRVLHLVFVERPFFRSYHAALACFITFLFGYLAWFPTFLIRHFGLDLAAAGGAAGFTYMAGGVAGTLFSIAAAGRRERQGGLRSTLKWFVLAMLSTVPLAVLIPMMPNVPTTIALYAVMSFLAASMLSIMMVPLQLSLPLGVQARAIAVFSFLVTAIGGTFGPLIIGLLSDRAGLSIGEALIANGTVASSLATFFIFRAYLGIKSAESLTSKA
jgi:MFS family permease